MGFASTFFVGIAQPQAEKIGKAMSDVIITRTRDERRAAKKAMKAQLSGMILDDLRKGKPMYQIARDLSLQGGHNG
jgi:hypothetical protein